MNIPVLILLLYYSNTNPASFTSAQAQTNFAATTDAYYENASYGQAVITEEAHGWYALPCTRDTCTFQQIEDAATAAAQADGVDTNAFNHRYYLISGGVTQLCGGIACAVGSLTEGTVWSSANISDPAEQIHEFGHSIGLNHADIGPIGGGGVYGSDSEVLPATQRNQLNWLDSTSVSTSGNYTITSVEQFSGTRAYNITKSDGTRYVLDYRQSYYGSPLLYVEKDSPTDSYVYVMDNSCRQGKGLRVGQNYYDSTDRILITLNSAGPSANLSVVLNSDPPIIPPDTTPPTTPSNLVGSVSNGKTANLNWTASTDSGAPCNSVITYTVYRNGVQLTQTTNNRYSDLLPKHSAASYYVTATDSANNTSAASNTAIVHT